MDLEEVMKKCFLWNLYPEKINRQDLFSIFLNQPEKEIEVFQRPSIPFQRLEFLRKIVFFNQTCRALKRNDKSVTFSGIRARQNQSYSDNSKEFAPFNVHPLDITTSVFLCCDSIARQDLVNRFWGCKLAFPFVIKSEQLEPSVLYLWPLKGLIGKYSLSNHEKSVEQPVIKFDMKIVTALRFGNQPVSKSKILNMLINKTDKEHPMFFHRDLEGSVAELSEICDGMIEAMPVFDSRDIPTLYLNLRGNCELHDAHKDFLLNVSDVIIILFSTLEMEKVKNIIEKGDLRKCKTVILLLTDLGTSETEIIRAESLEEFCRENKINSFIVNLKGAMHLDCLKEIWSEIYLCDSTHKIENFQQYAEKNHFRTDFTQIKESVNIADKFTKKVIRHFYRNKMSGVLPIQGKFCFEWPQTDIQTHRLKFWNKKQKVSKYRENLEEMKKRFRLEQTNMLTSGQCEQAFIFIESFAPINEIGQTFLNKGQNCQHDVKSCRHGEIFIREVKLNLENETRDTLNTFYKRYSELLGQLAIDISHASEITQKLNELDQNINEHSIGITDFTREMGQMYEVIVSEDLKQYHPRHLSKAAVKLLLYGYQIELMDGRSNYLSINWVKSVFTELENCLGNIRLKVISVLGVQSSGKSTLLNIMFGSQFAVGSGRCTRGAYMHLVKVSPRCVQTYQIDYVLVIDTEGLFSTSTSMEEFEDRDRKERELATFVIGLSNITIVNIFGENFSYLKDILPISVHAFLRMDLVGLNPKCKLVHHNVSKGSKRQLLHQNLVLQNALDEYTDIACSLENEPKRRFSDIIQFDIIKDVEYFPPLFESLSTQDIISPVFSDECSSLKEKLMEDIDAVTTIDEFTQHIGYLWNAIKRENFVYNFKNTIETKARLVLDKTACNLHLQIRNQFQTKLTNYKVQIINSNELDLLYILENSFKDDIAYLKTKLKAECQAEINQKLESSLLERASQKFRESIIHSSLKVIEECENVYGSQFQRHLNYKKKEIMVLKCDGKVLLEIDNFIAKHIETNLKRESDLNKVTDSLFQSWLTSVHNAKCKTIVDLQEAAIDCIYTYFQTQKAKVDETFSSLSMEQATMQIFLKGVPCKFWEKFERYEREREIAQHVITDLYDSVLMLYDDLLSGKYEFEVSVFKDVVLKVRTNKSILQEIHAKPNFEIELAVNLCGELIHLVNRNADKVTLMDNFFVMNVQQYFVSRCHEKLGYQTNAKHFVDSVVKIIIDELEKSIIENLFKDIADFVKKKNVYLASKQSLMYGFYLHLLQSEDKDLLYIYLFSFENGISSWISWLIDPILLDQNKIDGGIKHIIADILNQKLVLISERLQQKLEHLRNSDSCGPTRNLKPCVDAIKSALDVIIPVNHIGQFEHDKSEEIEASCIIMKIIADLQSERIRKNMCKSIAYRVLTTEEYDNIKCATVQHIVCNLLGCRSTCPSCGEICCIGEENHIETHKSIMHRPVGFNVKETCNKDMLANNTCWDEMRNLDEHGAQSNKVLFQTNVQNWSFSPDSSVEDNSFWKYVYAKHASYIAWRLRLQPPNEIAHSWLELDKDNEIRKLKSEICN